MTTLETLLSLTDRVQSAIDAGDWQQASTLESERRSMLEELVQAGTASLDMAAVLSDLRDRNYRLVGLVEHHRRRVLREATMVSTGHAGAARYAEARDAD